MAKSYDVKIEYDGGGKDYTQVVYEGDKVDKPKDPEKEGYKFIEWQKDGQKYNFETPVITDMILKANYKEKTKYEVTFDSDGGSQVTSQTVYEGEKVSKPKDPTKNDYSFGGWQLEGQSYDFNTKVTKNIILKAKWEEVKMCVVTLTEFNTMQKHELKINCGSKITYEQVENVIKSDCIDVYGSERASYCCRHQNLYYGQDVYTNPFDYNTVITKDIDLSFILSRGEASDGKMC